MEKNKNICRARYFVTGYAQRRFVAPPRIRFQRKPITAATMSFRISCSQEVESLGRARAVPVFKIAVYDRAPPLAVVGVSLSFTHAAGENSTSFPFGGCFI